jgi:hypothetical protein
MWFSFKLRKLLLDSLQEADQERKKPIMRVFG